jgi:hypothetical protein
MKVAGLKAPVAVLIGVEKTWQHVEGIYAARDVVCMACMDCMDSQFWLILLKISRCRKVSSIGSQQEGCSRRTPLRKIGFVRETKKHDSRSLRYTCMTLSKPTLL